MKKAIYVLGLAVIFCACKQEPVDFVLLSGKIANKAEDFKIIARDGSFSQTLNILEDGSFEDTLRAAKGTYRLFDGKNSAWVYLDNGSNIVINIDVNDFMNTLIFSGKGSEISSYLLVKGKREKELKGDIIGFFKLEEAAYKTTSNEIKAALESMIDSSEGISADYKAKERRNIHYAYLSDLKNYEYIHRYHTKNPGFKVSEGFLDEIEDLVYDNEEDFLFSSPYKSLVTAYYEDKAKALSESHSIPEDIALLKTYGGISNTTIKNDLLYASASYSITRTDDLEAYYSAFMVASDNDEHKSKIIESYNKLKVVANGQPSPQFVDYENNAGGTTSLDDLKGKFVYIDVWATWCRPCIAEIPFLKELEVAYHGKNIAFVSISIDKARDHDKWKKMIEEKELGGIQLFADKDWKSQFVQDYLVKGIPKFILIDPQGNIVKANAPRPSNDALITLFDELKI